MKLDIWLFDPVGGGIIEEPGLIVALPLDLKIVATLDNLDVTSLFIRHPGICRVTNAALEHLGRLRVVEAFDEHLHGRWWGPPDAHKACTRSARRGEVVVNIDPVRDVYLITYHGDNSTLIMREEY